MMGGFLYKLTHGIFKIHDEIEIYVFSSYLDATRVTFESYSLTI